MTKPLPWLRLYTEIIDDEKLGLLAFEDRWHFVALLCLKGKGVLDAEPDLEMLWRKVAFKMGLTGAELEKVITRLARMGLVERETLQPAAWDKRQMLSDSSAERTRKYREKQKGNAPKTDSDADETSQQRHGDALDTDTDTDTEEKKEKAKRAAARSSFVLPSWINKDHWDAWHSCPKRKKATSAQKELAVAKLAKWRDQGIDYAKALEDAAIGGWQGLFEPKGVAVSGQQFSQNKHAAAYAAILEG